MSRSQKNARRDHSKPKPEGGPKVGGAPDGVVEKDGTTNIAGNVTNKTIPELYQKMNVVSDDD